MMTVASASHVLTMRYFIPKEIKKKNVLCQDFIPETKKKEPKTHACEVETLRENSFHTSFPTVPNVCLLFVDLSTRHTIYRFYEKYKIIKNEN